MSVLFARTVLRHARSHYIASVPSLRNIELWYLSFVANVIASVLLPLNGLPSLGNFASLLGALASPDFWLVQLKYALFKGPENSLPQHRLVRFIPQRNWDHKGIAPFFMFDPKD